MKIGIALGALLLRALLATAQDTFTVTGTAIPPSLLARNYGSMPKGIVGYELTICNTTDQKQSLTRSQVDQALAGSTSQITPVASQVILASMLTTRGQKILSFATFGLNTAVGICALLSTSKKSNPPANVKTGISVASMTLPQLATLLQPVPPVDRVQKYETDVLPPALVLDSNSCVEKILFVVAAAPNAKPEALAFHIK